MLQTEVYLQDRKLRLQTFIVRATNQLLFETAFYKTSSLIEEVNRTEPFPSVRVPCFQFSVDRLRFGATQISSPVEEFEQNDFRLHRLLRRWNQDCGDVQVFFGALPFCHLPLHPSCGGTDGMSIQFNSIYSVFPNACTTIIFKCLQYSYTRVSW